MSAFLAEIIFTPMPPVVTTQPTNQLVSAGSNVTFDVTATGMTPFSYRWQLDGTNLLDEGNFSGSTSNTLTISDAQTNDKRKLPGHHHKLRGMVTSSVAVLTVTSAPPEITTEPTNRLVETGNSATFNVIVTGSEPLSYQWQLNGTNLTDGATTNGSTVSGSTNATLTISAAQTNDSGNYQVTVTNYLGSVTSSVAVLTVTAARSSRCNRRIKRLGRVRP